MTHTLSNLLIETLAEIGRLETRTATGGSTTTVVDSGLIGEYQEDDWLGGIVVIIGNAGAAPEAEFSTISVFDPDTGTITLVDALSAAVSSGTRFGLASGKFPLEVAIRMINRGLNRLGQMSLYKEVSLTALENGQRVSSITWNNPAPTSIEFCLSTGEWRQLYDWYFLPAAGGESGQVRVRVDPASISELRIRYRGRHSELAIYDDEITPTIPEDLAIAAAIERLLHWQYFHVGGADPMLGMLWKESQQELFHLRRRTPLKRPARQGKLGSTRFVPEMKRRNL